MSSERQCAGCGELVWPALEMRVNGGFDAKCPRQECGALIPDDAKPEPPNVNVVTLPHIVRPVPVSGVSPGPIGSAEFQYIRAVLAECQLMTDAAQIKQRLQRLSALVQ